MAQIGLFSFSIPSDTVPGTEFDFLLNSSRTDILSNDLDFGVIEVESGFSVTFTAVPEAGAGLILMGLIGVAVTVSRRSVRF